MNSCRVPQLNKTHQCHSFTLTIRLLMLIHTIIPVPHNSVGLRACVYIHVSFCMHTCVLTSPCTVQPDGSAAVSGQGLKVGQQILQVNSQSLHGLSHSKAVSVIMSAFEGPINSTTITFIVLDPQ